MEPVNFQMELNEEQLKLKKQLFETLLKDELVSELMKKYYVNENVVYNNTGKLKDYIDEKHKCDNCKGLAFCRQKSTGYYLNLVYENMFIHKVSKCEFLKKEEELLAHKEYYVEHNLSDAQMKIDISKLSKDESADYKKVVLDCLKVVNDPQAKKGLYLYGPPGVGKTYLMAGICNHFARNKRNCAFIHVPTFTSDMKMLFDDKMQMEKKLKQLKEVDILACDDIGGESVTDWIRDEILLPVFNERMEKQRLTFFTSNYSMDELQKHFAINSRGNAQEIKALRILERIKALSLAEFVNGSNRRL